MTNFLLLIGAGLFSKAIWAFQENAFIKLIGASSDDAVGTGPGSYDVRGNVWALNCCDAGNGSWSLFNAILGWQNSATCKTRLFFLFVRVVDRVVSGERTLVRVLLAGCHRCARILQVPRGKVAALALLRITFTPCLFNRDAPIFSD